jgi:ferritin-like metal-binding protein YciE
MKDLLVTQLKDLYNAETQVKGALERWSKAATEDELQTVLNDRIEQADEHMRRIDVVCNALDVEPTGEKCHGMEGLIEEGDAFIEDHAPGPVRDAGLIADAQRIEHYGIAGYGCARTYAHHLGCEDEAALLQKNLMESQQMDQRMTDLAERLLNVEVREAEATTV